MKNMLLAFITIISFSTFGEARSQSLDDHQAIYGKSELENFETLINQRDSEVKATLLSVESGVPTSIAFSKGNEILAFVQVSSNDEPVDITVGEVYDINGPYAEGDVCNVFGKLKFVDGGIEIETPGTGTAFVKNCPQAAIVGTYKKQ